MEESTTTTSNANQTLDRLYDTLTDRRSKNAFQTLWDKASELNELYTPKVLSHYPPASPLTYGEILPALVHEIILQTGLSRRDCFYDLGSGVGNVVNQAAFEAGCIAHGVEIREDLHHISCRFLALLQPFTTGSVRLVKGDLLKTDLHEATVVFVNNIRFDPKLTESLLRLFVRQLQLGTKVVALSDFRPRARPPSIRTRDDPFCIFRYPCTVKTVSPASTKQCDQFLSWTNTPNDLKYYIYEVVSK